MKTAAADMEIIDGFRILRSKSEERALRSTRPVMQPCSSCTLNHPPLHLHNPHITLLGCRSRRHAAPAVHADPPRDRGVPGAARRPRHSGASRP